MGKKSKKKQSSSKLPKRLLFIPSSDKNFIEQWSDIKNRDPLNFPASWRMVICGKPGCSKTMFLKNVCLRSKPKFQRIFILHQDRYAREYNDIDAEVLGELPPNDFWMGYEDEGENNSETEIDSEIDLSDTEEKTELVRPKTLCVIDDVCFSDMSKIQRSRLNRLCGFISSHCNVSLCIINQDIFAVDPICRKCASIWVLFKPSCTDELNTIARRCGMSSKDLKFLFNNIATEENDSITVDMTPRSPYKLRLNGYKILNKRSLKENNK